MIRISELANRFRVPIIISLTYYYISMMQFKFNRHIYAYDATESLQRIQMPPPPTQPKNS